MFTFTRISLALVYQRGAMESAAPPKPLRSPGYSEVRYRLGIEAMIQGKDEEAAGWFQKGAECEHPASLFMLSDLYSKVTRATRLYKFT